MKKIELRRQMAELESVSSEIGFNLNRMKYTLKVVERANPLPPQKLLL